MRREIFMRDDRYPRCRVMDRPLQMYALYHGKIHFFPLIMSVYRYMHKGSWSIEVNKNFSNIMLHSYEMIQFLKEYNAYTCMKYTNYIHSSIISYLYLGIYSLLEMGVSDFKLNCVRLNADTWGKYREYLEKQERVFEWIKGGYSLNKEECALIRNSDYVVIMGTGEYSHYVERVLSDNQISYLGYIVTSKNLSECAGKRVWELEEYPYDKNATLVIVGIHQKSEESVVRSLKSNGFPNFITPMWVYGKT